MNFLNISAIAVALAMDAFAVAVAAGVKLRMVSFRQTFRLSWHFGLFQALMPIIGWSAGLSVQHRIERYDHWIAFGLLAFVGGNMIRESLREESSEAGAKDPTRGMTMVMLSVATSIDALAVGFSISMLNVSIWIPAAAIGVVACGFTIGGLHLGKKVSAMGRIRRHAELWGGIVLFLIGLNILREHGALPL